VANVQGVFDYYADILQVTDYAGPGACDIAETGLYEVDWRTSRLPACYIFNLTVITDPCSGRTAVDQTVWVQSAGHHVVASFSLMFLVMVMMTTVFTRTH
jgi:hypothetical protein